MNTAVVFAGKRLGSKLDPYKPEIDDLLERQRYFYHKQRFNAQRMWEYLYEEKGYTELKDSYQLIQRYMREKKRESQRNGEDKGSLPLLWNPGEAQADFGEADFIMPNGEVKRWKYFVLSFPFSNRGLCMIMPGETYECVAEALQAMFLLIGKVPNLIVFDNATGIGRRICSMLQENTRFVEFRTVYGFRSRYCNPCSGNEKGNVEAAVSYFRKHLMVPTLTIEGDPEAWSKEYLLNKSFSLRVDEKHYIKNEAVGRLFEEDLAVMHSLPSSYNVATFTHVKLAGDGKVRIGDTVYAVSSEYAGEHVILEKKAWVLNFYTEKAAFIVSLPRFYGKSDEVVFDKIQMLKSLVRKAGGAWENSYVRADMDSPVLVDYIDKLDNKSRRTLISDFAVVSEEYGYADAEHAMLNIVENGHKPDKSSLRAICSRIADFPLDKSENPTGADLKKYDGLLSISGEA